MQNRILITGGSGFIGTNLVQFYLDKKIKVVNVDVNPPKNTQHNNCWKKVDVLDLAALKSAIDSFQPTHIIHLAARTDLRETKDINGYKVNYRGAENIIEASKENKHLKRIIFASTMLVCEIGYIPKSYDDYKPTTLYGESKVRMEKFIKSYGHFVCDWVIVRPTSIWGPWFGEPYRTLFDFIIKRKYFLIAKVKCTKTFGFIGNFVYQIDQLLFRPGINGRTFYLADKPHYELSEWASEINVGLNYPQLMAIPYFIFKIAAILGDLIKKFNLRFPISSFKLKNMTTNNIIPLDDLYAVVGNPPYKRMDGIKETLAWIKKQGDLSY